MSEITIIALLLITGVISGFVNTIAGGGSILAFLTMLLIGIPSTVANATNRVSIVAQSAVATLQFRRARKLARRNDWLSTALPALGGAVVGSLVAVELPVEVFDVALAIVLLLVVAGLFLKPKLLLEEHPPQGAWWAAHTDILSDWRVWRLCAGWTRPAADPYHFPAAGL